MRMGYVAAIAGLMGALTLQAQSSPAPPVKVELKPAEFEKYRALVWHQEHESRYLGELDWHVDLPAARKKAAEEGKPLLVLWGGVHPLADAGGKPSDVRAAFFADKARVDFVKKNCIAVALSYPDLEQHPESFQFYSTVTNGQDMFGGGAWWIALVTAGGKVVGHCYPSTTSGGEIISVQKSYEAWTKLPEAERKPKGQDFGTLKPREDLPKLPKNAMTLQIIMPVLDRGANGEFSHPPQGQPYTNHADPPLDYVWITEAETKAIARADAKKGQTFPLPKPLAERILRFPFYSRQTWGAGLYWKKEEIRKADLKFTVEEASSKEVKLRLEGEIVLSVTPELSANYFQGSTLGYVTYEPSSGKISRFDAVVIGINGAKLEAATYGFWKNPAWVGYGFRLMPRDSVWARMRPTCLNVCYGFPTITLDEYLGSEGR